MLHPSPPASTTLDRIVDAIVTHLHPSRIILLGSRARGTHGANSDYDIAVEFEWTGDQHDGWRTVNSALTGIDAPIDIFVRRPGQIKRDRDDPGRTDWDIWREGIVLWPEAGARLAYGDRVTAPPARVREGPPAPPASVRDWLARAEQDLLIIDAALAANTIPWGAVAFHAQQAAEKYLKLLLISRGIRPPHTHDLTRLVLAANAAGAALPTLTDACATLNQYAVDVRYPENIAIPNEAAGRAALAAGRLIVSHCIEGKSWRLKESAARVAKRGSAK
jgi:HEPN domain-containing protein/predicted nucleotidyltransferase